MSELLLSFILLFCILVIILIVLISFQISILYFYFWSIFLSNLHDLYVLLQLFFFLPILTGWSNLTYDSSILLTQLSILCHLWLVLHNKFLELVKFFPMFLLILGSPYTPRLSLLPELPLDL
jgi:hypothetical protein